ncbi:unnamed protein product [Macrosiphum euphorbiae]|uniref:Uncharacterized protein n=1 Tax=Macrosiphum euphorbiae TaxID=13131 RepID=A0AAV0Y797_9HEMI|nr:unnamed protein product [Macrosiphum euphorbiae]
MSFSNSNISDYEESMTESDNNYNEVKPGTTKKQNKTKRDVKLKKNMCKTKVKKNISYLDRIALLIKDVKVDNELINSMMVKQSDEIVNIKLPFDNEVCSDYWTINHYKIKNIQNLIATDRWKEAECSVKVSITDLAKDQGLANDLSNIIQTIFTRFMSDPNKKTGCIKKSKS